jgi:hypothetical protein
VVAAAIREVTGLDWHGGRLVETGIHREPLRRRPMIAVKAAQMADRDDRGLAELNALIAAGESGEARRRRAAWVAIQQALREGRKAERAKRREERAIQAASTLFGPGLVRAGLVKRQAMVNRVEGVKALVRQEISSESPSLPDLSQEQMKTLSGVFMRLGLELPDLDTAEGRSFAWGVVRGRAAEFRRLAAVSATEPTEDPQVGAAPSVLPPAGLEAPSHSSQGKRFSNGGR